MDKSSDNKAAIDAANANRDVPIVVRQVKYLNNIVEQDPRAIFMHWQVKSVQFKE
jgi:putative transposase